jgi:hypothetical protein
MSDPSYRQIPKIPKGLLSGLLEKESSFTLPTTMLVCLGQQIFHHSIFLLGKLACSEPLRGVTSAGPLGES